MTVCKELGYERAKFLSGGSYFQPEPKAPFTITNLECNDDDLNLMECFGDTRDEDCHTGTGAGVICE